MFHILFKNRPKTSDISVTEFALLMDKYISLAQCSKDVIDTKAKEFLFAAIEMRGIPATEAYFETEEIQEEEPYEPRQDLIINRDGKQFRIPLDDK